MQKISAAGVRQAAANGDRSRTSRPDPHARPAPSAGKAAAQRGRVAVAAALCLSRNGI